MDLSVITMDDGGDGSSLPNPTPEPDGVVVLAQPAANPSTSKTPAATLNIEDQQADRNPTDAPAP